MTTPQTSDRSRRTVLYGRHVQAEGKIVPFAGWEMPVEYPTGIFKEHAAVRTAAGLFDVSHMSAVEFKGANAEAFLDAVLASGVTRLVPGRAQYSYLLSPDGTALDDLYVYRASQTHFYLVLNASNADRDAAWFRQVLSGKTSALPDPKLATGVQFRELRDAGPDSRVVIAFQGPATVDIIGGMLDRPEHAQSLKQSKLNDFLPGSSLCGIPVHIAHTGYTGAESGFELFVHPDHAGKLWDLLLERGRSRGVLPCGLGARDSLRIEAGLPLFGHELEGDEKLSLTEAGYGFAVRMKKPFFIGKNAYAKRVEPPAKRLLRLKGSGRRSVRGGHVILDAQGTRVGVVTSFAFLNPNFDFMVLAAVDAGFNPEPGSRIQAARVTRDQATGAIGADKRLELTVLPRFATAEEKQAWASAYRMPS
jgi:glycine cleavage system T protein